MFKVIRAKSNPELKKNRYGQGKSQFRAYLFQRGWSITQFYKVVWLPLICALIFYIFIFDPSTL